MSATRRGEWIEYECARIDEPGRVFSGRYRPEGDVFHAEPGSLECVPRRALLPLRDRRARAPAPRRDPPRAVAAAARGGRDRADVDLAGRARRRPDLPLLAPAGRRDLAARACRLNTLRAVTPQRRTALFSVLAALALIGLKLGTGLATHSLGLLSEAAHSGTDLVAALLTFFAVGVAARPADVGHQYGHGKAEHLSALAEGAILVLASLVIVWRAIVRLTGQLAPARRRGVVRARRDRRRDRSSTSRARLLLPARRGGTTARRSRRTRCTSRATSAARSRCSSACCSCAHGYPKADSIAALFVACIVLVAAVRLMRGNVDVLMDRVPPMRRRPRARDRGHRACGRAPAAAHAPGRRPGIRRRRDRRRRSTPRSGRATRPRTRSSARSSRRCPRPTSSCTSSRWRATPRCASARTRLRSACRRVREVHNVSVARRSARAPSSRCT